MPRGHRGTKKPKWPKPGERVVITGQPGSRIELGPGEVFYLPVQATVKEIVFHSLCIGWAAKARIDGAFRDGVFELQGLTPLDPLTNFIEKTAE